MKTYTILQAIKEMEWTMKFNIDNLKSIDYADETKNQFTAEFFSGNVIYKYHINLEENTFNLIDQKVK